MSHSLKEIDMIFSRSLFRNADRWILASVVCFALAAAPPLCGQDKALPEGKGRDKVLQFCTKCHGTEGIVSQKLDRQGWADLIQDMKRLGLELTKADYDEVLEYLAAHFNDAPAKQK